MHTRRVRFFWILLITSLWAFEGQAQPRFEAIDFGFNGRYLPETLTPLLISISNGNTAVNATLEVAQELRDQNDKRVQIPVALAPRTRKTLSLDFLVHGVSVPVKLRLLDERRRVLVQTEIELRERWSERPLALALEAPQISHAEIVQSVKLPKRWTSYESLRRIYWGRLDPARLSDEQRTALYRWVLRGGELVILGGRYAFEQTGIELRATAGATPQGWWAALLPLRLLKIVESESDVRVEGALREGTRVVARDSQGRPLWWERPLGLGRVWLSATADPGAWEVLSNRDDARADEALFAESTLGRETIPAPSRARLALVMVLFVMGVGAAGMWALRRPKLGFIVPVWTLFVALLLWGYLRNPDFARHYYSLEMNLLLGWSGEPFAWEQSWYALFARRAGEQQLAADSDSVKSLTRAARAPHGLSLAARAASPERLLRFYSEQESVRSFKAERFLPTEIEFSLDTSVSPAQVWVSNKSSTKLEQAVVHLRGTFYILGEIAARSETEYLLRASITEDEWARRLSVAARALWQRARRALSALALVAWRESTAPALWGERMAEQRHELNLLVIAAPEGRP